MTATAVMIISLWLIAVGFRRVDALLERSHSGVLKSAPQERVSETEQRLWRPLKGLVRGTRWLLWFALIFFWLHIVLAQFPPTLAEREPRALHRRSRWNAWLTS